MTMKLRLLLVLHLACVAVATSARHGGGGGGGSRWMAPIVVGLQRASLGRHSGTSIRRHSGREASQVVTAIPAAVADLRAEDFVEEFHVATVVRGGAKPPLCSGRPPARFLTWAYGAAGLATTAAWSMAVYTTIRSNQPLGAMMPCWQHGFFARTGAMAAAPLIMAGFAVLAKAASTATDSWDPLGTPTCRRHNLALATTGVGSALWTYFAETITKIPGTETSHQVYQGAMKWGLIGCYGAPAVLAAAVWARSLPDNVRRNPLQWPGRIADGVSQSLVSLAPANRDDPVNVKYALLTTSFLVFTGLQTVCNMPIAVMPSWTSRRLSRAFATWTLLGATTSFDLKEAAESGKLLVESNYRTLSNGLKGFGVLYFAARSGVFFDPSFPKHFGVVNQVPGLAVACALMVGLTLRSDKK